jgi:hypothetical protein
MDAVTEVVLKLPEISGVFFVRAGPCNICSVFVSISFYPRW